MTTTALLVVLAVAAGLVLPVLTMLGAHRRGLRWPSAILAGVLFPGTWVVWYVSDEHPYHRGATARSRPADSLR